jgi:hypothetical protein
MKIAHPVTNALLGTKASGSAPGLRCDQKNVWESPFRVINVVSGADHTLPLHPRFQTHCCLAANDVQGQ